MFQLATLPPLMREKYGSDVYEFHPLGDYVVIAPQVCGGRPTFKYTRLETSTILALLTHGATITEVVAEYEASNLTIEAVQEALNLAQEAFQQAVRAMLPLAQ